MGNRMPKSKTEAWRAKLVRNQEREADVNAKLRGLGWQVREVWECETRDFDGLIDKLVTYLNSARATSSRQLEDASSTRSRAPT
jgi:DNA mismatch endonuclease, patch repair protein